MTNVSEELARLAKLRDDGVLSEAEFEAQKAQVLRGSAPAEPVKKKSKLGIGCGVIVAILVVLFIIGAIAGGGKKTATEKDTVAPLSQADSTAVGTEAESEPAGDSGVTMAQFNQLRNGMTYDQVIKVLGSRGQEMSRSEIAGIETVMYQWEGSSFGGNMNAMFQNGKLIQKAQFGLK
jgi:hypothetical protein